MTRRQSPDDLWARVDRSMVEAGAERRRRRALLGSWRGPIVAVLVLGLGLLGALIYRSGWQPPGANHGRIVRASIEELQTFLATRRPLDVASGDPMAIRSWFESRVGFSLPPPPLTTEAELIGGRICRFLRRSVAAYMYHADGQPIALYLMPAEGLAPSEEKLVTLGGRGASVSELHGFASVFWRDGDLVYLLVSDLPQAHLIGIAEELIRAA